jgi:2-alkenal reductase
VPIDAVRRSLKELLAGRTVAYAYAGVQSQDLTPALARHLGLAVRRGALITEVTAGGPAAKAGLRGGSKELQFQGDTVLAGGDVVVAVGGIPVSGADDLVRIVTNSLRAGQTTVFTVVRDGRRRSVAVTLAKR